MTTDKPLTDLSAQCVLKFMKTNSKIHLIQKCPSLRNVEAAVPWKLDKLFFHTEHIQIDDIIYKIGISRHYSNGENPKFIQRQNREGGVDEDVDRYGFRTDGFGDIYNPTGHLESNKSNLRIIENEQEAERVKASTPLELSALKRFDEEISERKAKILPYYLRRDGAEPPFTHYLQFTVKHVECKNGVRRIERFIYNKKIAEPREYLFRKLFENQARRFEVNFLIINHKLPFLPMGPKKLKVRHLQMGSVEDFLPVLDFEKFPLDILDIFAIEDYNIPLITSTRKLIIHRISPIISIPNQRVHLKRCEFRIEALESLIQNWKDNNYEIGRHYSISLQKMHASSVEAYLRTIPGVRMGTLARIKPGFAVKECYVFRRNDISEIVAYVDRDAHAKRTLHIAIKQKGFAKLLRRVRF